MLLSAHSEGGEGGGGDRVRERGAGEKQKLEQMQQIQHPDSKLDTCNHFTNYLNLYDGNVVFIMFSRYTHIHSANSLKYVISRAPKPR